jgi:hypothetical protein
MAGFLSFAVDACDWFGRVIRGAVTGCFVVMDRNAGYLSPVELLTEAQEGLVRGGWKEMCGKGSWKESLEERLVVIVDKEERVVGGAEQETRIEQHKEDVSSRALFSSGLVWL